MLTLAPPSDHEIALTREFAAPRRLVFDAWTRPELLGRWYGAEGWTLVDCAIDLRVGGEWCFVSRGPDGTEMEQRGVYLEIDPPARFVTTERFGDGVSGLETVITTTLEERGGRTTQTIVIRYPTPEARDAALATEMRRGMAEGFARLDGVLAELV